ncbi:uncharacterized protein LOC132951834 [Metopolophium dirhodum]|uniref:uncharacterized protein LOC132951834 n=1 Tax=Metopolophium dirhodum TaxID=44670 RepID=UPI002990726B|nr:uncharacterized protein LOC132951834 [Metopolophium dirhodum]
MSSVSKVCAAGYFDRGTMLGRILYGPKIYSKSDNGHNYNYPCYYMRRARALRKPWFKKGHCELKKFGNCCYKTISTQSGRVGPPLEKQTFPIYIFIVRPPRICTTTMYYNSGCSSGSRTHNSEKEFTEHALSHILKHASPYALRRSDDDDRPLLDELNNNGYIQIKQLVHKMFPECDISKIRQVYAPQMYGMYMLRHEEMKLFVGQRRIQEKLLYHVTTESKAMESLNSGLDWRRTHRSKFGRGGVSFCDDINYANYYADNSSIEETRVIMICSVLVGETYVIRKQNVGNNLIVPPGRADTTMSHNGRLFVKYNDNEFYPLYFVYYQKRPEQLTRSKYFRASQRRAAGRYDGRSLEERCSDHLDATGYYDDDDTLEQMCSDHLDATGYYDDDDTLEQMCSDHLDATGYYDDDDTLEQMCSDHLDATGYYDD